MDAPAPAPEAMLDIRAEPPALQPMPGPTPASAVPPAPENNLELDDNAGAPIEYRPAGMQRDDEPPADDDYLGEADASSYAYLDELASHAAEPEQPPEPALASQPATGLALQWLELYPKLPISGLTGSIAANCSLVAVDGDSWVLHLDPAQGALFNATQQRRVNEALNQLLGRTLTVQIELVRPEQETPAQAAARRRAERQQGAEQAIAADPFIRQLAERFGATVRDDTIEPLDALANRGE
jgi:DNA polymerase-3 subunit gamma/tau